MRRSLKDRLGPGSVVQLELVVHRGLLGPRGVELGRVLVDEVSVLRSTRPTEVLDLHHLRQDLQSNFLLRHCLTWEEKRPQYQRLKRFMRTIRLTQSTVVVIGSATDNNCRSITASLNRQS